MSKSQILTTNDTEDFHARLAQLESIMFTHGNLGQTPILDTVTDAQFSNNYGNEPWIQGRIRHVTHVMSPLNVDNAGSNSCLLDNVGVNIRLEPAKPRIVLRTCNDI